MFKRLLMNGFYLCSKGIHSVFIYFQSQNHFLFFSILILNKKIFKQKIHCGKMFFELSFFLKKINLGFTFPSFHSSTFFTILMGASSVAKNHPSSDS